MRRTIPGLLAAATLVLGAGTAGVVVEGAQAATSRYPMARYAQTYAHDGVLKRGCHDYSYRYVIKPTTDIWALETFLVDPTGTRVASGAFLSGSDPKRGKAVFRFCRAVTRPGVFTIKGKYTYKNSPQDGAVDGAIRPTRFRLTRP